MSPRVRVRLGAFLLVPGLLQAQMERPEPSPQEVDVVFLLDGSGSMRGDAGICCQGILDYLANANAQDHLDLRCAVVLMGRRPELVQDFQDPEATIETLAEVRTDPVYQGSHRDQEPGLEAIRMALGTAPVSRFDIDLCVREGRCNGSDGYLRFRENADPRVFLLFTDEDSDRPFHAENRFPGQATLNPPDPASSAFAGWQEEIDATASQLALDPRVALYLFVDPSRGRSLEQYGDPACDRCAGTGLRHFDPTSTLVQLHLSNGGAAARSFQAESLRRRAHVRSFDVTRLEEPGRCDEVFDALFGDLCETCLTCPGWRIVGPGHPSSQGSIPTLTVMDEPRLGRLLTLTIQDPSMRASAGILLLSDERTWPYTPFGEYRLYVGMRGLWTMVPFTLRAGGRHLYVPVPPELPGLPCHIVHAQALLFDTQAPRDWNPLPLLALTPGIEIAIGP